MSLRLDRADAASRANHLPTLSAIVIIGMSFLGSPAPGSQNEARSGDTARRTASLESAPSKPISTGTFTDKAGARHIWQITESHALRWDNAPYLPIGGTFAPRSFINASEAAWQEDMQALTQLKSRGLYDLLLTSSKPLAELAPAAVQRVLDYLDANDFRYGLSFGPGMTQPLTGTVVKPNTYRFAEVKDTLSATWQVTSADYGYYLLTDTTDDNKILSAGVALSRDDTISVPVELPQTAGKVIALLFPHKSLVVSGDASLPDIWTHFDDYRDRTLRFLSQIKFGKGFRFFHDPLTRRIGLGGETDYLIPDSPHFRLEWEGFLTRKYPNAEEARFAWGVAEEIKSHRDLARLIPLWANSRGIPYFHDSGTRKNYRMIVEAAQSKWWQDFLQCRNESILYHMNAMADVLKREVAEVPVIYTWTQTHPIFWNTNREGGFDGLGVGVRGGSLIARVIGPAYAVAEQAARTMWCVATEIVGDPIARAVTANENIAGQTVPAVPIGYHSQSALNRDLDSLRRVGIKGFFADGFQVAPGRPEGEWIQHPECLNWLREYGIGVEREGDPAGYAPHVLFYPQSAPGPARVGLVPGTENVLWLNSFYAGEILDWWPLCAGYIIQRGEEAASREIVLMSLSGRREVHFHVVAPGGVADPRSIQVVGPDGKTPVPSRITGKNVLTVFLDEKPTIFRAGAQRLIPQEAAESMIVQLDGLYALALQQKYANSESSRPALDRAKIAYKQKDFETAYVYARAEADKLTYYTRPYIWLEGEDPRVHTFTEVAANHEASSRGYLRLSTPNPPNRFGYAARYEFDVTADGRYDVWLAGTLPGPNTSPIKWRINSDPVLEPNGAVPQQPIYLSERFGWTLLGTVNLKRGTAQTLSIYVSDRAVSPSEYIFAIDALLLTPHPFQPRGAVRPLPVDPASARRQGKL